MNSTAKDSQKHVVVLGTAGAGLTAAIAAHDAGLRVSVFEKADKVGGTTAWSGGMIWIPNNHHEQALGIPDSRDEALTYLLSMSHGLITRELAEAFIDAGPLMVRYLEEQGPVQFRPIAEFPDYHAEFPGGKTEGGRCLDCPPYSFDELGAWAERVTPSPYYPDPRLAILIAWESVEEARLARMLDPMNAVYVSGIGVIYHDCLMLDSALVYFDEAVREDSTETGSRLYRSSVYATKGRYREALRDVERAVAVNEYQMPLLAAWYVNVGDTLRAKECFEEVLKMAPKGYWGPSTLAAADYWVGKSGKVDSLLAREEDAAERAFAYCCLGRVDQAFTALEGEYHDRPRDMVKRINSPWLVFLKRDPRYGALLRRAGIKEQ